MADTISKEHRSRVMASVRQMNTKPELLVRRSLHAQGFRFRLHDRSLPGSPDIVLPKHRAIVMVHGCFWHGHGCRRRSLPITNSDFWCAKIERNVARDAGVVTSLEAKGWRVLTLWECAVLSRADVRDHALAATCDWIKRGLPTSQIGRKDIVNWRRGACGSAAGKTSTSAISTPL